MAWYEREHDGRREVRVIEVRGANVWERSARAAVQDRVGPGRVRLAKECLSAKAADLAAQKMGTGLLAEKWVLLDPDAGIDALHPKSRPPKVDERLSANNLERALNDALKGLPQRPTVDAVVEAFGAVMRTPVSFRRRGYCFEVHFPEDAAPGTVSIRTQVGSSEGGCWREIGLRGTLEIVDGRETIDEVFDTPGGRVDGFLTEVRASESFGAIADLRCSSIEAEDFEID